MLSQCFLPIDLILSALTIGVDVYFGLLIAVPAIICLILYLILWDFRSRPLTKYIPPSTQTTISTPPMPPATQTSHNVVDTILPPSLDFVCSNFSSLNIPLLKNMPRFRALPPRRSDPQKKITKASEQWEKEGKLDQTIEVAKRLLSEDIPAWKQLQESLRSSQQQTLQQLRRQLQDRAVSATLAALQGGRKRSMHCSEALVCYTALLFSISPEDVLSLAIIYYCRGFTYALLALDSPSTVPGLLNAAGDDCVKARTLAESIYLDYLHDFLVIIDIAYGDICVAAARYRVRAVEGHIQDEKGALAFWQQTALDAYRNALGHVSNQQLRQVIVVRITQANQLGL